MKTIGISIMMILAGVIASVLSSCVQMRTDDSEKETIGIQKKWGFPITYRTTAPGLSWPGFNGIRFEANCVFWAVAFTALTGAAHRIKKNANPSARTRED